MVSLLGEKGHDSETAGKNGKIILFRVTIIFLTTG